MEKLLKSIVVFCDGACSGNPGPGGWGAIVANPEGKVWELGARETLTTNNQMELTAAIRSLEFIRKWPGEVFVHTDSTYVIQGITKWIFGWRKRDWKSSEGKDVANRDLWEELFSEVMNRGKENKISWRYVRGHAGIAGNDRADEIAVAFSKKQYPDLYKGPLLRYGIALYDIPEEPLAIPEMKSKSQKKTPAYSYLSLIGDIPYRHATWAECERRVKGQSGAKFKKANSAEDEAAILRSWKVDPKKIKT
jgi:ribonuclease HI